MFKMNWEKKIEMVKLGNANDQQQLTEFALKHIFEFDEQAWCMYLESVELTTHNILQDLAAHKAISLFQRNQSYDSVKISVRSVIYEQLVSELIENHSNNDSI